MGSTWIKYYEKINYWEHRQDLPVFSVFMYLVSQAVYEPKQKKGLFLHPGQCTVTYTEVCRYAGVSDAQLRRAVKLLVESETIKWEGRDRFSLVTIVNWEEYQSLPTKSNVITNGQKTQTPTDKKRKHQRTNNEKTNDSYRRIDEQTNRRIDEQTFAKEREAPTPEVLSNFDKSESGKPEAPAVNTQAEPEGQKKKSSGQKRKGTEPAISEADFVAAALPEKFNPRQPGYLDLCNALSDFYREKKGKKTVDAAKACKHQLEQYDIRTCINSLQMAALNKWQGFNPKRPGPEFMPHLIEQQPATAKPAQTQINGSSLAIDKLRPGWLQQNIKYLETYKNFAQALDLRADLYFLKETGRLPNASELNEVKKAHEGGKIDLMALNLDL